MTSLEQLKITYTKILDFYFIPLESNFYDLYQTYLYKNCEVCEQRPAKSEFMICLLCGDIICLRVCPKSESGIVECGNMNAHALIKHSGSSVFLDAFTSRHLIVEAPKSYFFNGIYRNKLGYSFGELRQGHKDLDLKEFDLDEDTLQNLRIEIMNHNLCNLITQANAKDGKYLKFLAL